MSDLALWQQMHTFASQLPIYTYFDADFYQLEKTQLFNEAPVYYGHVLMTPEPGDYHSLDWLNHAKILKNAEGEIKLLSNVCRHRQALIYKGRGNKPHFVCNLHGWTYNATGQLIGAPHFSTTPCLKLEQTALTCWHGMLFDASYDVQQDLATLAVASHLNFDGYVYHSSHTTEYGFNWKTFVEVYAEDYHVEPFHPGLGHFVDCQALQWHWGPHYHAQTVGIKHQLNHAGSKVYQRWHQAVLSRHAKTLPEFGAIWLVYYPNIMVEWYPEALVISVALPKGPECCMVITEFYYPEDIAWFETEFIDAQQAAYFETAKEDDEICYRIHEGRRSLWLQGLNEVGPYQSPTEEGMRHFHEFYRRKMKL